MDTNKTVFIVMAILLFIAIIVGLLFYNFSTGPFHKKIKKKDWNKYYDFYELDKYHNCEKKVNRKHNIKKSKFDRN